MNNSLIPAPTRPVHGLEPDETVVLYPTFGHLTPDGQTWQVGVSGVMFAPGRQNLRRKMFIRVLQRLLGVSSEELTSELFLRRIDHFLVATERGRRIAVELGGAQHGLQRPTKRNGHFRGSVRLGLREAEQLAEVSDQGGSWLRFRVATGPDDGRLFAGSAQLIGPVGLTVISDIDDTIKLSEVADRRRLLCNTFLREFIPVPGMSDVYRAWASAGAVFHYVSSSPWQLYDCLGELLHESGFPEGSFHLKPIRLRDPSVLRLFVARRSTKRRVIRSILRMFPHRRFILVGDSGERDPEIYGAMARQFPRQVERIRIRHVAGRPANRDRLQRAFREVPADRWALFDDAAELLRQPLGDPLARP